MSVCKLMFKKQRQCRHLRAWSAAHGGGWCPDCHLDLDAAPTEIVVVEDRIPGPERPSRMGAAPAAPGGQGWWVTWYAPLRAFELHSPWWQLGSYKQRIHSGAPSTFGSEKFTAAVQADTPTAAWATVLGAYGLEALAPNADGSTNGAPVEGILWDRIVPVRGNPFEREFARADWMVWEPGVTCRCGGPTCPFKTVPLDPSKFVLTRDHKDV